MSVKDLKKIDVQLRKNDSSYEPLREWIQSIDGANGKLFHSVCEGNGDTDTITNVIYHREDYNDACFFLQDLDKKAKMKFKEPIRTKESSNTVTDRF